MERPSTDTSHAAMQLVRSLADAEACLFDVTAPRAWMRGVRSTGALINVIVTLDPVETLRHIRDTPTDELRKSWTKLEFTLWRNGVITSEHVYNAHARPSLRWLWRNAGSPTWRSGPWLYLVA